MKPPQRASMPMHIRTLFLILAITATLIPTFAAFGGPDGDAAAQVPDQGTESSGAQVRDHDRDAIKSPAKFKLDALNWLAGSWINDDGGRHIEEIWTAPAADLMLGMSRTLSGGRTASFEFMRISVRADGVFYIAQPRGRPPVEFSLQSWDGAQAIFINPGNGDHLKRVIYRHNSDGSFTARIEGANQGAEFAEDYPYHRAQAEHVD